MAITREDMQKIWTDVKANSRRLRTCTGPHQLEPIGDDPMPRDYRCAHCGGKMSSIHRHWYEEGLRHAAREAADD